MKYNAKIMLREENLQDILAEYFGVDRENVRFNVMDMQRGVKVVNCDIIKEMEFPQTPGTVPIDIPAYVPHGHDPWNPWNPVYYGGPINTEITLTENLENIKKDTDEGKEGNLFDGD